MCRLHEAQRAAAQRRRRAGGWLRANACISGEGFQGRLEKSQQDDINGGRRCCSAAWPPPAPAPAQSNWGSARQKAFQASVPTMYIAAVAWKMREKLPVFSSTKPHTARHSRREGRGGECLVEQGERRRWAALQFPSPGQQLRTLPAPATLPPTRHSQDARQASKSVAQPKEAPRVPRRDVAHVCHKPGLACGRRRRRR